ncbi:MAG: VWA domain-containing protein, partial [Thermoanaerobaculia bacterium]
MSKSPSSVSRFLPLLALLVAIPPVRAQEAPRFEEEAQVVTVEVPVQVGSRGGRAGLTAEDFTILDDGQRRPIEGFEVVDLRTAETGDAGDPGGAAVPPAARRHLLLLFDLSFSDPASIERAREAGHEVVTRGLVPSDRVAVAAYRAAAGVELVLGFTPDHAQVEAAIDGLGTTQPLAHHRDPLALVVADAFDPGHPYKGGGGGGNNKAKRYAIMRDNYRDLNNAAERAIRDHQESDVLRFMASLEEVASLLRDVPGRKQVVLLSEGFDDTLLIGTEDVDRLETMSAEASRGAYWRVDSEERFGSSTVRRGLEMTVESLRRAGCSVQAVDIGGVRTGSIGGLRRQGENGLFALADATGGELLRNHNDLAEALERLLDHQSVTYVLAFAANDVPEDGAFHRLEVKVPGAPGGARVLHQPGYYAPRPYGDLDATERRVRTAGL